MTSHKRLQEEPKSVVYYELRDTIAKLEDQLKTAKAALEHIAETFEIDWADAQDTAREALKKLGGEW